MWRWWRGRRWRGCERLRRKTQIGSHHFCWRRTGSAPRRCRWRYAAWRLPVSHANDLGRRIHEARPSMTFSASRPPTPTAITPSASTCGGCPCDQRIWVCFTIDSMDHRTHALQIDLVHDAVARWNHLHILERALAPVDEVKAVFVTAVFDGTVLLKGVGVGRRTLRPASGPRSIARAPGLTAAGSPPWSAIASRRPARSTSAVWPRMSWQTTRAGNQGVALALAFNDLRQAFGEDGWFATAHQVFSMHAAGVGRRPRRRAGWLQRRLAHRNSAGRCRAGACDSGEIVGIVSGNSCGDQWSERPWPMGSSCLRCDCDVQSEIETERGTEAGRLRAAGAALFKGCRARASCSLACDTQQRSPSWVQGAWVWRCRLRCSLSKAHSKRASLT